MTEPVKIPEPWERQEGETEEAWLAFKAYRDMPPDMRLQRRAAAVARATLSKWYRDHNWYERCKAYDDHFDSVCAEEKAKILAQTTREVAVEHMAILADMRELVATEFQKLVNVTRRNDAHGLIQPGQLIRMAETMVKLDRLVRGETTENVGTTDLDLTKLSVDELKQLHALLERAEKTEDAKDPH